MKKIFIIIFIFLLSFSFLKAENKTVFYWTKKCEVLPKDFQKVTKIWEFSKKWDILYKSWKIYKKDVYELLLVSSNWNPIYLVKTWEYSYDLYNWDKKILENIFYSKANNYYYDKDLNYYYFSFFDENWKYYFVKNDKIFDWWEEEYRVFSENKKFFIDIKESFLELKDWKIDVKSFIKDKNWEEKKFIDYKILWVNLSNDGKYSLIFWKWNDYDNTNREFLYKKWWKIEELKWLSKVKYSPSWKDFYYVTETKKSDDIIYKFFKNWKEIWEYLWEKQFYYDLNFTDEENFYVIMKYGWIFHYIENWKQTFPLWKNAYYKNIVNKKNGDKIELIYDYNSKKDILYKNRKEILRADNIDERYISDDPFPVFSVWNIYNSEKDTPDFYTYAREDWKYFMFLNWIKIYDFYDYLDLLEWFNHFTIAFSENSDDIMLMSWTYECKDITFLHNKLENKRKIFKIFEKVLALDEKSKMELKNKVLLLEKNFEKNSYEYDLLKSLLSVIENK